MILLVWFHCFLVCCFQLGLGPQIRQHHCVRNRNDGELHRSHQWNNHHSGTNHQWRNNNRNGANHQRTGESIRKIRKRHSLVWSHHIIYPWYNFQYIISNNFSKESGIFNLHRQPFKMYLNIGFSSLVGSLLIISRWILGGNIQLFLH